MWGAHPRVAGRPVGRAQGLPLPQVIEQIRGTRIMVWQVLEMLADGMAWETIIEQCHNSITKDAIAEAVKLSGEAFLRHADEFVLEPTAV